MNNYNDLNLNDPDLEYLDDDFLKFLEKNRSIINKMNSNYPSWRGQQNKRAVSQQKITQATTKLAKIQSNNNYTNIPPRVVQTPLTTINSPQQQIVKKIPSCGNISFNEQKTVFNRKPQAKNLPAIQSRQSIRVNDENYIDKYEIDTFTKAKNLVIQKEEFKPQVTCKAWGIYKESDATLIFGENTYEIREMASITKIMTCLISLKLAKRFGISLTEIQFSVSKSAININGTSACLEEDQWYSIEDLLYGLMLPSGNDAAICLAENFGCLLYFESIGQSKMFEEIQSVDVREDSYVQDYIRFFLKEMNKFASQSLLRCTTFANPHGLTNKINKSNCNDLAKITYKALKWRIFRKIVSTKTYTAQYKIINSQTKEVTQGVNHWKNTNKLLDSGFQGVKTGITTTAGACLSSLYQNYVPSLQKVVSVIIIVLGSSKQEDRFDDTQLIIDWHIKQLEEQQQLTQ